MEEVGRVVLDGIEHEVGEVQGERLCEERRHRRAAWAIKLSSTEGKTKSGRREGRGGKTANGGGEGDYLARLV